MFLCAGGQRLWSGGGCAGTRRAADRVDPALHLTLQTQAELINEKLLCAMIYLLYTIVICISRLHGCKLEILKYLKTVIFNHFAI